MCFLYIKSQLVPFINEVYIFKSRTLLKNLLEIAIEASLSAGKEIIAVYEDADFDTSLKEDNSPLTKADLASSKIINSYLSETEYSIINEEIVNEDYSTRRGWQYCWIVDPLDGTKEFIKRNGEFTVNIALCSSGVPVFGVIYVPVTRELYYADVGNRRSYKSIVSQNHELLHALYREEDLIEPAKRNYEVLRVVGSRSHMNEDTIDFIEKLKDSYKKIEIVSKGSSLKFCLVAEGKADIYPRFAPTMEWDTAAGHAICVAVGLKVTRRDNSEELNYNKEDLLNPHFVVQA